MIYILVAQSIQLCVSNMNPLKQEQVYGLELSISINYTNSILQSRFALAHRIPPKLN